MYVHMENNGGSMFLLKRLHGIFYMLRQLQKYKRTMFCALCKYEIMSVVVQHSSGNKYGAIKPGFDAWDERKGNAN